MRGGRDGWSRQDGVAKVGRVAPNNVASRSQLLVHGLTKRSDPEKIKIYDRFFSYAKKGLKRPEQPATSCQAMNMADSEGEGRYSENCGKLLRRTELTACPLKDGWPLGVTTRLGETGTGNPGEALFDQSGSIISRTRTPSRGSGHAGGQHGTGARTQ
ncbi:hypothetical protein EYF80_027367 [Liparis tanakae]|uniref:Uncharacterized protein n=1 Tax=Liparis tanakae TaxID=230148 RepID=A0A4Z2H9F4_9TELE|nr:hypothetical protein EYF80_027367 [Liparis tanakae]